MHLRSWWLALASVGCALAVGCGGPAGDLSDAEQPIVNGTLTPTLVSLSSGQQLAIGYLSHTSSGPFCTGTLIGRDVVLTAGHCVKDAVLTELRFGLGHPSAPRRTFELRRVSESTWEHDTALIQLREDATRAVSEVRPLPINRSPLGSWIIGSLAEVSGYHAVSGDARRRFAVLEVTNLLDAAIVADGNGVRGSCQGDSGGPILLEDSSGNAVVAGVTLGGHVSCVEQSYYSRTDVLTEWIDGELSWFASSSSGTGGSTSGNRRTVPSCAEGGLAGNWPMMAALLWFPLRRRRRGRAID